MDLLQAIQDRRSIKVYTEDTTVEDSVIIDVINHATYAPNHGMREPWRVIWIKKEQLQSYAELFAVHSKMSEDKAQKHIETVTKLSGILLVVGKVDRRQRLFLEDVIAVGAFMQNISLLLHSENIGSCIKTPEVFRLPKFNDELGVALDEMIFGQIYLTSNSNPPLKERKNINLIIEWHA